jgi:hypothetical protein
MCDWQGSDDGGEGVMDTTTTKGSPTQLTKLCCDLQQRIQDLTSSHMGHLHATSVSFVALMTDLVAAAGATVASSIAGACRYSMNMSQGVTEST